MTRKSLAQLLGLFLFVVWANVAVADDAAAPTQEAQSADKPATAEAAAESAAATEAAPADAASPAAEAAAPADWTYWRGPQMNGNSTETGLPDSWDPEGGEGSNLVWKRADLGSRSTPIVMNGRVYTLCRDKPETREEGEKIVCVDLATGETVWEQRWNVYLSDVPDTRVAWSAVTGDPQTFEVADPANPGKQRTIPPRVYALGVSGLFQCFNANTGEVLWSHSMHEEYGLLSTYGGRTNFPLVVGDNVIVSAVIIGWGENAKPNHRYIAFDKYNGQPVWFEGTRPLPEDTTYSAPVLGTFNGQLSMVFGGGDGVVYAFQPRTGKKIWEYPLSERGVNTSPLIYNDHVIIGHSEENIGATEMGALVCLNGADGTEVWKNVEMFVGKSPPIIADGLLVACEDGGRLMVLDPANGKELFNRKVDTMMRGSPLYADGKLYVLSANGRWWIFKINKEGEGENLKVDLEEVHKLRLNGEEGNGSPIAANGKLLIPTSGALYCVARADASPAAGPLPEVPAETPRSADDQPALVQVVPVESLLFPGDAQQLDVRLYNANGQWIRNAKSDEVTFSVAGIGSVDANGDYSTDKGLRDQRGDYHRQGWRALRRRPGAGDSGTCRGRSTSMTAPSPCRGLACVTATFRSTSTCLPRCERKTRKRGSSISTSRASSRTSPPSERSTTRHPPTAGLNCCGSSACSTKGRSRRISKKPKPSSMLRCNCSSTRSSSPASPGARGTAPTVRGTSSPSRSWKSLAANTSRPLV
ncbi:MAG: PQQ-binding-like beta-propeller repeat protein [Planctomycetaceae bacterium]